MNFVTVAHIDPFALIASLPRRMGHFKDGVCPAREDVKGWPELTAMLQRIKRLGDQLGGIEYGKIELELLPAGACLDWRIDRDEAAQTHEHAIMMLRTSPAVTWFAGPEPFVPAIGFLNIVSRQVPRSAINLGEAPAIWLAMDFRRATHPRTVRCRHENREWRAPVSGAPGRPSHDLRAP